MYFFFFRLILTSLAQINLLVRLTLSPLDGDVLVGTPDGRAILLGGLRPLALAGVEAAGLSMVLEVGGD